jgi:hypothetical protein
MSCGQPTFHPLNFRLYPHLVERLRHNLCGLRVHLSVKVALGFYINQLNQSQVSYVLFIHILEEELTYIKSYWYGLLFVCLYDLWIW